MLIKNDLIDYSENANEAAYQHALIEYNNRYYSQAADIFRQLCDYKDSAQQYEKCCTNTRTIEEEAEKKRKDKIIDDAVNAIDFSSVSGSNVVKNDLKKAIKELSTIKGWKNADSLLATCENRLKALTPEVVQNIDNKPVPQKNTILGSIVGSIFDIFWGLVGIIFLNWILKKIFGWNMIDSVLALLKKVIELFN